MQNAIYVLLLNYYGRYVLTAQCVCLCDLHVQYVCMSELTNVPLRIVKPKMSYNVESSQQSTLGKQINKPRVKSAKMDHVLVNDL